MSKKLKGVRLESNWDTFQTEHPEVKLAKDCNGKILSFSLINPQPQKFWAAINRQTKA